MEAEPKRQIIDGFEQALRRAGAKDFEDAGKMVGRFSAFLSQVAGMMNREKLGELLDRVDWPPEMVQMCIAMINNLPPIVTIMVQNFSGQVASNFPVTKSGRPKALTRDQRRAVCDNVTQLFGQGIPLKVAKQRAAQKFGVSLSTVERFWAARKKAHEPSLDEIITFLTQAITTPTSST